MGNLHAVNRDWAKARRLFRRALQLNPSLTTIHTDFVVSTLFPEGKLERGGTTAGRSVAGRPSLPRRAPAAGARADQCGPRTIAPSTTVIACWPSIPPFPLWRGGGCVLFCTRGASTEAIAWLETQGGGRGRIPGLRVRGERPARGSRGAGGAEINEFPQRQAMISMRDLATPTSAFDALERLAAVNPRRAGAYLTRPELASIQGDARMAALRRKLGLPGIGSIARRHHSSVAPTAARLNPRVCAIARRQRPEPRHRDGVAYAHLQPTRLERAVRPGRGQLAAEGERDRSEDHGHIPGRLSRLVSTDVSVARCRSTLTSGDHGRRAGRVVGTHRTSPAPVSR